MCTSIAVYKDKPIYAMNFDYWNVESRIRINNCNDVPVFFFEINQGGEFLETAGMNANGFFGNFQGNLSDKHKNIVPDSNCMTIDKFYRKFLNSAKSIDELTRVLDKKTIVYPPVPPEYNKLHNMFADKNGGAIIVETSNGKNDVTTIKDNFLVMTNFPVGEFKNEDYKTVFGIGSDRYKTAYEYISNIDINFGIDNAFEILENTVQKEESFETLISMVFVPTELTIYISVKRDFKKIWKVDITKNHIETFRGFKNKIGMDIDNSGILISNLQNV